MCGRYALALRPSQIRRMLEDDDVPVADAPQDDGSDAPRQSYNFAPGYYGLVYRAETPNRGDGPRGSQSRHHEHMGEAGQTAAQSAEADINSATGVRYKLQSMRWGLVPFWTKRDPNYASLMRTINCRDDSLGAPGGMWATMKARKRCIVIAQGFFEWLKTGPKDKLPHYVKRMDGRLMCFAGLWDCVEYEGSNDKNYTYTVITTDSNKQLEFLHHRMPVIFDPDADKLRQWLDPSQHEWSCDLQSLLKPFDGELEIYPVSKDVGKVGNNSPSFITPLDSKENKSNIANFFASASRRQAQKEATESTGPQKREAFGTDVKPDGRKRKIVPGTGNNSPPTKKASLKQPGGISSTRNNVKTPTKSKLPGPQKITKFFSRDV